MKILGIDYGRKKIGLALAEGKLAQPYKVLKVENFEQAVKKVENIIVNENFDKVVVGISENEIAKESQEFAQKIGAETFDETLSTHDAQSLSIDSGMKRKKRKEMEDAYAAALILQNYLNSTF